VFGDSPDIFPGFATAARSDTLAPMPHWVENFKDVSSDLLFIANEPKISRDQFAA
jgi:hypothetical protein